MEMKKSLVLMFILSVAFFVASAGFVSAAEEGGNGDGGNSKRCDCENGGTVICVSNPDCNCAEACARIYGSDVGGSETSIASELDRNIEGEIRQISVFNREDVVIEDGKVSVPTSFDKKISFSGSPMKFTCGSSQFRMQQVGGSDPIGSGGTGPTDPTSPSGPNDDSGGFLSGLFTGGN